MGAWFPLVAGPPTDGLSALLEPSPLQLGLTQFLFEKPHIGNPPYMIVPPYMLEYQDPVP